MRPDAIRDAGLRELGVHERLRQIAFSGDGSPRPHEERVSLFGEYKTELKKQKKALAKELHPDANGDLPEAECAKRTEKFKRVTRAIDFVLELNVRPPPPPRPVMRVVVIGFGGITNTTGMGFGGSTMGTTSTAGFWTDIVP